MAAAAVKRQPDIQYHPDYEKYVDRSRRRLDSETLPKFLPAGLPQQLSTPFVWDGKDIQGSDDCVVALSEANIVELDQALKHFKVFHTDSGDIVSLFCLESAAQRGESQLASIWNVYNILAKTRPDLIPTLTSDWVVEGFGNPRTPYTLRPLLHYQSPTEQTPERLIVQYASPYFTGFSGQPRYFNIPPITEAQAEALDALHFLGEKHSVRLDFQNGDIQCANNLAIFPAREGFQNAPNKERHLLRLWLRDSEYAWKTPERLQNRWDEIYKGRKKSRNSP